MRCRHGRVWGVARRTCAGEGSAVSCSCRIVMPAYTGHRALLWLEAFVAILFDVNDYCIDNKVLFPSGAKKTDHLVQDLPSQRERRPCLLSTLSPCQAPLRTYPSPAADHSRCCHAPSCPKGRRINWKYQSDLLPKFQRAAAQGASKQVSSDLRAPRCGPMTAADENDC